MTRLHDSYRRMRRDLRFALQSREENKKFKAQIGQVSAQDLEAGKAFLRQFRPCASPVPLVRLGGANDGGYLLPDDFEGITASFSPGVAGVADFDLDVAARGIPCFLIDASVDAPPVEHPLISFDKKFLGRETAGNEISLDDWVSASAPGAGDLLLQIDIEGAEYETLGAASDKTLKRFRMIVIEFHFFEHVFEEDWRDKVRPAMNKLAKHFAPVHLHPNNHAPLLVQQGLRFPRVFEVTYLRRDRLCEDGIAPQIPHPLDGPNLPGLPDYVLPPFWDI